MENNRTLIVENNLLLSNDFCTYLEKQGLQIIDKATCYYEAIQSINRYSPDMIFIDSGIIGESNGIQIAQNLKEVRDIPIFFLVNPYEKGVLCSAQFDFHTSNSLLKQGDGKEAHLSNGKKNSQNGNDKGVLKIENGHYSFFDNIFFVKDDFVYYKIHIDDLKWVEAHRAYCEIVTTHRRFLLTINMNMFNKIVQHPSIIRVHRSFLVNISKIDAFERDTLYIGSKSISIGPSFKKDLVRVFPFIEKSGVLIN